jgi:hypothetical protein
MRPGSKARGRAFKAGRRKSVTPNRANPPKAKSKHREIVLHDDTQAPSLISELRACGFVASSGNFALTH